MSPDAMRARFWEATAELEAIRSTAKPLRDEYDAKSQEIARLEREALQPLRAKLKAIEAPCYDLDMERSALARALNRKVGPKPGSS